MKASKTVIHSVLGSKPVPKTKTKVNGIASCGIPVPAEGSKCLPS